MEHLLDVFTSIDPNAHDVWRACSHFMEHLYWHKPRQTVLGPKIEGLPDGHLFKAMCLLHLSRSFQSVGNFAEEKRLLTRALSLWKKTGDDFQTAQTLRFLCHVNQELGFHGEGIQQAEEALKMHKRLCDTIGQARCLTGLAQLLLGNGQLDAAENAALQSIDLLPKKGQEFRLCQSHRVLGEAYGRKGEKEKAIGHFETALRIASPPSWQYELSENHYKLAELFLAEDEFADANTHVEQAKSHTTGRIHDLSRAMELQARVWYRQCRLEDARCEALGALEIFEKLGAAQNVGTCRELLQEIERATESRAVSGESTSCGELSGHGAPFHEC